MVGLLAHHFFVLGFYTYKVGVVADKMRIKSF